MSEIHQLGPATRHWELSAKACPALAAYQIQCVGWTDAAAGYCWVQADPPSAAIAVCSAGAGHVRIEGTWRSCGPDQAYLMPARAAHGLRASQRGQWRIYWIKFDTGPQQTIEMGPKVRLCGVNARLLQMPIDGLELEMYGDADPARIQAWVDLIYLHAVHIASEARDPSAGLWQAVAGGLDRKWTVSVLAELAAMSGEHLRRLCITHLGHSPMRHVTHLRMRRAASLLACSAMKVEGIAKIVGYDSGFAFSHAFKRHLGLSPAKYRRECVQARAADLPTRPPMAQRRGDVVDSAALATSAWAARAI